MTARLAPLVPWIVTGLSLAFITRVFQRDWPTAIFLGALIFIGAIMLFALTGREDE